MLEFSVEQTVRAALEQHRAGRFAEAEALYRQALAKNPNEARAWHFLGVMASQRGEHQSGAEFIQRALTIRPNYADAWNNLSLALLGLERYDEAEDACRRALALEPRDPNSYNSLGALLRDMGRLDEALAAFRAAVDVMPQFHPAHSNILFTMHFMTGATGPGIRQEAVRWNQMQALGSGLGGTEVRHDVDKTPGRKLRVGYVSPDFREHCQSLFTVPLFSQHDHERFEIIGYSAVTKADALTERLRSYCDGWRDIATLSHQQAADLIRADRIDILVDLTMHMQGNRLLIFARRPAPVQITWLAYPGTTGLSAMDYRVTDSYLDPADDREECHTEKALCLPASFWCYDPLERTLAVNALPAASAGYVTFGCLGNFCKVNAPLLEMWRAILQQAPGSRLIMLAPPGRSRERVIEALGEAAARVEFVGYRPRREYLETYHRIDLSLDTFSYNGHTTSLDGLWMGVPVVSLAGDRAVSRAGLSQLSQLELAELVAWEPGEYVRLAVALAGDWDRLAALRGTLRQRMEASPLMDAAAFARGMEALYQDAWAARAD